MRRCSAFVAAVALACDTGDPFATPRQAKLGAPPLGGGQLCQDENPISSDDYCPQPHIVACYAPSNDELSLEFVNEVQTSFSYCMDGGLCTEAEACEGMCCAAYVERGYLLARKTCMFWYGAAPLYFEDGPCRRQTRYTECMLECWDARIECHQLMQCHGLCGTTFQSCFHECVDQYGHSPYPDFPGYPLQWDPEIPTEWP